MRSLPFRDGPRRVLGGSLVLSLGYVLAFGLPVVPPALGVALGVAGAAFVVGGVRTTAPTLRDDVARFGPVAVAAFAVATLGHRNLAHPSLPLSLVGTAAESLLVVSLVVTVAVTVVRRTEGHEPTGSHGTDAAPGPTADDPPLTRRQAGVDSEDDRPADVAPVETPHGEPAREDDGRIREFES